MRKQWWPRLFIEIGDEKHEFKTFMASEMQKISELTNGTVTDRAALIGYLASEDALTWRAITWVARKRQGNVENFDAVDLDLASAEAWAVDEAGREVDLRVVPLPCRRHLRRGVQEDCESCALLTGPETDKDGNLVWYFTDDPDGDPVPTSRARRDLSTLPSI